MASFEKTQPVGDSPQLTSNETAGDKALQQAALYSLGDLRAAEAAARKAAEGVLKHLPGFPIIPGDKPQPARPAPTPKPEQPVKPADPPPGPPRSGDQPPQKPVESVKPVVNKIASSDLQALFDKNFDRLDTDKDGFVSGKEIDNAMASSEFHGKDALLLDVLKKHKGDLESLSNDEWGPETNGVSRADMAAFEELRKSDSASELATGVDKTLTRAEEALDRARCREPFADPANPVASIKPESIVQGRIQDSCFLAALGSLAKNNPQAVASMIHDNGDRTYTVTFPGDPDNPVTVAAPTDAELARYAGGTQLGTWPAILEKAYGAKRGDNTVLQDGADVDASLKPMRLLNTGGVDTDFIAMTDSDELNSKMTQAFQDKVPVTARAAKGWSGLGLGDTRTDDGVPRGQDYAVVGYDAKSQTVTLYNPRGFGEPMNSDGTAKDGKNDGTFTMTLAEFQRNFSEVSYGQV